MRSAMGIDIDLNSILGKSLDSALSDLKQTGLTELTNQLYQSPEVQQQLQEQLRQQSVQASGNFFYDYKHILIPAVLIAGFLTIYGAIHIIKK